MAAFTENQYFRGYTRIHPGIDTDQTDDDDGVDALQW
jgi:hypothetical protein